ncbi:hypothetical protein HaLaN_17820, partial [Haematococcus lacustris]
ILRTACECDAATLKPLEPVGLQPGVNRPDPDRLSPSLIEVAAARLTVEYGGARGFRQWSDVGAVILPLTVSE